MRAGLLTEQIAIYRPTAEVNVYGERVEDYHFLMQCRARVYSKTGSRTIDADEITYPARWTIDVWQCIPVQETDRIEWRDKKYRILSLEHLKTQLIKRLQVEEINE